ncbi:MAG: hypothetical protein AB7U85_00435 [Alphaproteobacteria bacterium]
MENILKSIEDGFNKITNITCIIDYMSKGENHKPTKLKPIYEG